MTNYFIHLVSYFLLQMRVEESESTATAAESANQSIIPLSQQHTEQKTENLAAENIKEPVAPSTDESKKCADETSKASKTSAGKDGKEQKDDDVSRTMSENKHTSKQQTKEATGGKTETNDGLSAIESPKFQKKTKKTKKKEQQQPVSEHAIPLPPPPTESAK